MGRNGDQHHENESKQKKACHDRNHGAREWREGKGKERKGSAGVFFNCTTVVFGMEVEVERKRIDRIWLAPLFYLLPISWI